MRAARQLFPANIAMPRGRAIAILADAASLARLESVVSGSTLGSISVVYRGTLRSFACREGDAAIDLVLLHLGETLDPRQCAAIEALTRRFKVVITGNRENLDAADAVQAARAWSFINLGDLSASVLDNTILGLERARHSEDRLLRALGEKSAQLPRVANAASLMPPVVERIGSAIWQLAGFASVTHFASEAGDSAAVAFDVVDELNVLKGELAECVKMSNSANLAPRAANLNEVVEDFARDCFTAGIKTISAQTGSDPIIVKPAATALRQLLDALLATWSEVRQPNDKLELLTWDPGHEARIAIVLTKASDTGAIERAPAHVTMRNIFRKLHPLAQACGVDVEADWTRDDNRAFSSMTLCLPKQSLARTSVAAAPYDRGATLEDSPVRDCAG